MSETLLRAIRDGERRMTPETRRALVAALRRWAGTCERLAGDLEAADPDTGGDDAT